MQQMEETLAGSPTFCVAGTKYVGTLTWPPARYINFAAAKKSSVFPPVQDLPRCAMQSHCDAQASATNFVARRL
jgi:hypothetical protein